MRAFASPSAGLLGLSVATAVLWEGGYGPASRVAFVVVALLALIAAALEEPGRVAWLSRRPPVVVLWLLGLLGLLSAAWTIGLTGDAVRWGLVTLGYGAVAVTAGVLAGRPGGVRAIAAGICVLAAVSGIVGLAGVALEAGPFADRVAGAWRPGGTLEYSSALALLQVSALPALLTGMASRRPLVRAGSALGGLVALAVLVLAGSRAELAMAAVVVVVAAVWAPALLGRRRRTVPGAVGAIVVLLASGALLTAAPGPSAHAAGVPARTSHAQGADVWHGRTAVWRAALRAAEARPVTGAGADAFLVASLPYASGDPVTFAHDLPLELAAELGAAGLLLALALYGTVAQALWRARRGRALWLLGPAAAVFLVAGLVDWEWHLAGSGAVWAAALGGLLGCVGRRPDPVSAAASTGS